MDGLKARLASRNLNKARELERLLPGRLWPVLTPQQLIGDLYASPRRLAAAAPSLRAADRELLRRQKIKNKPKRRTRK